MNKAVRGALIPKDRSERKQNRICPDFGPKTSIQTDLAMQPPA
jgi:hypothetical protein